MRLRLKTETKHESIFFFHTSVVRTVTGSLFLGQSPFPHSSLLGLGVQSLYLCSAFTTKARRNWAIFLCWLPTKLHVFQGQSRQRRKVLVQSKNSLSQAGCYGASPIRPVLRRWRQKEQVIKVMLSYMVSNVDTVDYMRQCLKKKKKKKKKRPRESSTDEKFLLYQKIQSSVPSTHISQVTTTCNSSTRGSNLSKLCRHPHTCAHMLTYMHIIKNSINLKI